jgi:predicted metalloprotease with PDZ domain
MAAPAEQALHYAVRIQDLHAHLFEVTLTIPQPSAAQIVQLPVWIPGSYLVREFSKSLQNLSARQGRRQAPVHQLDKCSWQIDCKAGQSLTLSYTVYALDRSVRTAWLDAQRGFFNGTSLFLSVDGQEARPHQLTISAAGLPSHWKVATALDPVKVSARGTGIYQAEDYDALVDAPVEMGDFWSGSFKACGVTHRFVVAGAPANFDGKRLMEDTRTICETEIRFWHGQHTRGKQGPQQRNYLFMLNAEDNGYGGLEHRNSTALICKRADLPQLGQSKKRKASDGYTTLLGLISHEYFHTWNVKRLRPAEFARLDYQRENYTELLWFFEGLTSYYDDLLLRRAGLIDDMAYLVLLAKTANAVSQTPGRLVQTVAQASFDAWVKYYRQDENTPNHTVSYYTKGALVGLCLDLSLRQGGRTSLDAVMRALWQRCAGGPMSQDDVLAVLEELSGQSYAQRIAAWVHSTAELPIQELLQNQGVKIEHDAAPMAERLGLRVSETAGVQIRAVLRGSAAEKAGLCAGDEWLGMEVGAGRQQQGWRLGKLDELALYLGPHTSCVALISRDKRLLRLKLTLPKPSQRICFNVQDQATVASWLQAPTL